MEKNFLVPIREKVTLTIDEAAAYSNIGINRISNMLNSPFCPFVYYVGTKRLVKRKEFEKYLEKTSEFDMKNLFRTKKGADSCPIVYYSILNLSLIVQYL